VVTVLLDASIRRERFQRTIVSTAAARCRPLMPISRRHPSPLREFVAAARYSRPVNCQLHGCFDDQTVSIAALDKRQGPAIARKPLWLLVPVKRVELPTFALRMRCSTN
jgi:hypothetical protein